MKGSGRALRAAAAVAIVFGVATVISGGRALFYPSASTETIVPFVLYFNFTAGFFYVAAGFGLWAGRPWAPHLSWLLAVTTFLVFAAFGVHIALGGAFALRTVFAMMLRTTTWFVIAGMSQRDDLTPEPAASELQPPSSIE